MHATKADVADTVVGGLNFLWLEITGKCNLTCTHCYADSGPQGDLYGNMTYTDWARVLDEAAEQGCRQVQFIGGEPTMHPRLHDLVDHANHRHYELIEVYTNATRLGKELLGCFQRNGVQIATSFYSENASVHERITQVEGSWERTVEGIRRVVEAKLPLRVGVVETSLNAGHPVRAVEFLKRMGIVHVGVDRERGIGRGGLIEIGGQGERFNELCGQCWKGKLCVVPSGEAYPCIMSRKSNLGDVRLGLDSILLGSKLKEFKSSFATYQANNDSLMSSSIEAACTPRCFPVTCGPHDCNPYKNS